MLQSQLERVSLPVGARLVEPNTPIEHVCFLEAGIASVVAATPQGRRIEAGIVGREGLAGLPILLGLDRTPHACFVQTAGAGLRIRADDLRRAMAARTPGALTMPLRPRMASTKNQKSMNGPKIRPIQPVPMR